MPRHDGSRGVYHSSRSRGGKISRRRAIRGLGRKDGNTQKNGPNPQSPKGPKGGSKGGPRPVPKGR